jgi:mannose-6-phosphate isomerase-like protein (cupin superfamily)
MNAVLSPRALAAGLTELWSPRIVGEVNDAFVKVAKVHGALAWHRHDHEDELFLVLQGRLRIELEDGAVELAEGEMFVVPRGVLHNPVATEECLLLLLEPKTTRHTGDVVTERTRSLAEQLRPLA